MRLGTMNPASLFLPVQVPTDVGSFQTLGSPASFQQCLPKIRSKIEPLLGEGFDGNSNFWEGSGRGKSLLLSVVTSTVTVAVIYYKTLLSAHPMLVTSL